MMNNPHAPQLPMTACYAPLSHGSLFSGIGGFDLAAEWVGWNNRFHCEWNEFGQRILKHYWPNAESYGDITKTDFTIWRGRIDVLTGGFPCQPYSLAGKRLGKDDERHLWPEMLRAIHEISPRYIVGENVAGLLSWNGGLVFDEVQTDLEAAGYEILPVILPACAVNAPHKRERVWFIAHARNDGQHGTENGQSDFKGNDCNATGTNAVEQFARCGYKTTRTIANTESQQSERMQPEQREFSQQEQRQLGGTGGEMGYRNDTDTTSELQQGNESRKCGDEGREVIQQKHGETNTKQPRTMGENGNATNPRCSERKNRIHGEEQGWETAEFGNCYTKLGAWAKFPITEPTICGGNDGISPELDGITFPKWRNESIKAFGNAIVPQVAYQIFKAIQLHAASYGW